MFKAICFQTHTISNLELDEDSLRLEKFCKSEYEDSWLGNDNSEMVYDLQGGKESIQPDHELSVHLITP